MWWHVSISHVYGCGANRIADDGEGQYHAPLPCHSLLGQSAPQGNVFCQRCKHHVKPPFRHWIITINVNTCCRKGGSLEPVILVDTQRCRGCQACLLGGQPLSLWCFLCALHHPPYRLQNITKCCRPLFVTQLSWSCNWAFSVQEWLKRAQKGANKVLNKLWMCHLNVFKKKTPTI